MLGPDPISGELRAAYLVELERHEHERHIGAAGVQNGLAAADAQLITEQGFAEFQAQLEALQRREVALGAGNVQLITNVFRRIVRAHPATSSNPHDRGSIIDSEARFTSYDHWLAHHKHTTFVVPPDEAEFGSAAILRPSLIHFGAMRLRAAKRPIALWVVGEQFDSTTGTAAYIAVTSSLSHQRSDLFGKQPTPLVVQFTTEGRLPLEAEFLPSRADAEAAYDAARRIMRFNHDRKAEDAKHYPIATTMTPVAAISDVDMQNFGVPERLAHYPVAFDITIEDDIRTYSNTRQQIAAWNGRTDSDSLQAAFVHPDDKLLQADAHHQILLTLGALPAPQYFSFRDTAERERALEEARRNQALPNRPWFY